ncbi:hypothetical protein HZI73_15070 [Vallitalea pronyensis]|uniref:FAD-dependent protein C-terminal domain-containing protein n=1 Tax=Vallitalea pronyensis TaxID=1348613 RepID=A0A8J8MLJ6_9FIRM|nr:hypothetical protein [Vallitalea pronyensis]QUI23523.1 hypothetical protein HZI73_15070 [Vallitalea pronyensis]
MIRLQQLKFRLDHKKGDIKRKILKVLHVKDNQLLDYSVVKKSIDARKKNDIRIVYTVDVKVKEEEALLARSKKTLMTTKPTSYQFPHALCQLDDRPVVIGTGPAGLFCGLILAEQGLRPILLERGEEVNQRVKDVQTYFNTGELSISSNVQFGEGGAGTFSDGKLNTMVKDKYKRNQKVLEEFVAAGAPKEILFDSKPHIGTDYLREVVQNMREKIIGLGGEVRFHSLVTSLVIENEAITGVQVNDSEVISTQHVVLAIGHSARDTFRMLKDMKVAMEKKPFAIGLRIEHPQIMINKQQYGDYYQHKALPVADYKLSHHCLNGRGVYSFCMCPGGYVVNASSELGHVVTNGMSNYLRDEANANSALLVNVTPDDFPEDDVLAGVTFQRKWESLAFDAGGRNYHIPVQLAGDFMVNRPSTELGEIQPSVGRYKLANLRECLPPYVCDAIQEGIQAFDKKIPGFGRGDAILSGVETRSSSPIRILRDDIYMSNIRGLYPCGEGAGYAGGIMSAAMDGIKVAEAIVHNK